MAETVATELEPFEFDTRWLYLFQAMIDETPMLGLKPEFFFPHWRRLMELKAARTWVSERAILGACFVNHTFSSDPVALISFWFGMPDVRGTGATKVLIQALEKAARNAGCRAIYSASHSVMPEKLAQTYCRNGFTQVETQFRKILKES